MTFDLVLVKQYQVQKSMFTSGISVQFVFCLFTFFRAFIRNSTQRSQTAA